MPIFVDWADTTTPFLAISVVIKAGLFEVISTSSQPINSVAVANGYSLLMALKLPPKKSRATKTAWFGAPHADPAPRKLSPPAAKRLRCAGSGRG